MSTIINLFPEVAEKHYFQHPDTKEFWFHATAVCKRLGYSNVTSALMLHTDEDERFKEMHYGRETWFVSEAGFYGLALGAKTDEAKRFKRWLKHDILPKLRATGLATARMSNESVAQYKLRETQLVAENQRLLKQNRLSQGRLRYMADSLYHQQASQSKARCFDIWLERYLKGFEIPMSQTEKNQLAKRVKVVADKYNLPVQSDNVFYNHYPEFIIAEAIPEFFGQPIGGNDYPD